MSAPVISPRGNTARVGACTLFVEMAPREAGLAERLIRLAVACLTDGTPAADEPLTLSSVGARADYRGTLASLRARGGAPDERQALITRLVRTWNGSTEAPPAKRGKRGAAAAPPREPAPELHRHHLSVAGDVVALSAPGAQPLRATVHGGTPETRAAMARRLATTWNVNEGWRTPDLEAGALRSVGEVVHALAQLATLSPEGQAYGAQRLLPLLAQRLAARDALQDLTHGRPHDCSHCLGDDAQPEPVRDLVVAKSRTELTVDGGNAIVARAARKLQTKDLHVWVLRRVAALLSGEGRAKTDRRGFASAELFERDDGTLVHASLTRPNVELTITGPDAPALRAELLAEWNAARFASGDGEGDHEDEPSDDQLDGEAAE